MLRKRIIFTLIYSDGFFTQSRNFRLQKVGNINWLEKNYHFQDISFSLDELIVLNATRDAKNLDSFGSMITQLVDDVFIPISAGGGIRSVEDAQLMFNSGADKIVLNTMLYENPELIQDLASKFGSQSIIASVDFRNIDGELRVFINNGALLIDMPLKEYLEYLNELPVGEVYLNSIDKDGTGFGFDLDVINRIGPMICHPLIIAGGAGNQKHLEEGLMMDTVSAVATANLFNFIGNGLPLARKRILASGLNIADWDVLN